MNTSTICDGLRGDPVLSLLIPERSFRTVPYPYMFRGQCLIGFYFFQITGNTDEVKNITAPIARVSVLKDSGAVVEFVSAPLCLIANHNAGEVVGTFPSPALSGLPLTDTHSLYRQYFDLTDALCAEGSPPRSLSEASSYSDWRELFERVCEDGYLQYLGLFDNFNNTPHRASATGSASPLSDKVATELDPLLDQAQVSHSLSFRSSFDSIVTSLRHLSRYYQKALLPIIVWADASARRTRFTVACIGESSRGKSSLINSILGEELLPTGDVPTTKLPIRIRYGRGSLLRVRHVKEGDARALDPTSHCNSNILQNPDIRDGLLDISLDNEWLKESGVSLVDTPGINDICDEAGRLAIEAINEADAVLMLVNATLPLSQTERYFIQEALLPAHIPRLAVALSRMDTLSEKERAQVVDSVSSRLGEVGHRIALWITHDVSMCATRTPIDVCGPDLIRKAILEWTRDPHISHKRSKQAIAALRAVCGQLRSVIAIEYKTCTVSENQRQQAVIRNKNKALDASTQWDEIRRTHQENELRTKKAIADIVRQRQAALEQTLQDELSRSHTPTHWWAHDFDFSFKKGLSALISEVDRMIQRMISKDAESLWSAVSAAFDILPQDESKNALAPLLMPSLPHPTVDQKDPRRYSKIFRLSAMASTPLLFWLGVPLAPLAPIGVMALTEKVAAARVKTQKKEMNVLINDCVEVAFTEFVLHCQARIRDIYSSLYDEIQKSEVNWTSIVLSALDRNADSSASSVDALRRDRILLEDIESTLAILENQIDEGVETT